MGITRIATASDVLLAHNINLGDMLVVAPEDGVIYLRYDLGLNPATGLPYTGGDINTSDRMLASLGTGKKILFVGNEGRFQSIRIYLGELDQITITNTLGQLYVHDDGTYAGQYPTFQLLGGTNIKVTGKYVQGVSGDRRFLGEDDGHAYRYRTYGIVIDRYGLPGLQAFTVEGDDRGELYGDARYFAYVAPASYEIEYVEIGWGGFTIFDIKQPSADHLERYNDFNIHHCYLHDGGSESLYNGNNAISVNACVLTNFLYHHNTMVRMGTEGMQWGMLGVGCKIYNNVIKMPAMQWRNLEFAFGDNQQANQDGMMQLDVFDGSVEVYNNKFIGGGGSLIRMNGTLTTYTDGVEGVVTGTLKVYNNYFEGTRSGNFIYIGQDIPQITNHLSLEIYDNFFKDLRNDYVQVGGSGTEAFVITNNNDDNTISIHDNEYDTSMEILNDTSSSVTITEVDNTQTTVEKTKFMQDGFDVNHDPRNFEQWAAVYGTWLPNAGDPIIYPIGRYVYHERNIYEAINENSGSEPPSADWRIRRFPLTDVPLVPPFNPYTSIAWVGAGNPATGTNIAVDEFLLNYGSAGNFVKNGADAVPTFGTVGGDHLLFAAASSTSLTLPGALPATTAYDVWLKINVTDQGNNQFVFSLGGGAQIRINTSTGVIVWGTTTTAVSISFGTTYLIRFTRDATTNGTITINNGTPVAETVIDTGASTGLLGAKDGGTLHSDHKQFPFFYKTGNLSAQEVTNMWTFFGY